MIDALTERAAGLLQWMLPRPTDIMSLRLDNTERQTVELADIVLSSTRYMASWLRQRSWVLPQNRQAPPGHKPAWAHALCNSCFMGCACSGERCMCSAASCA